MTASDDEPIPPEFRQVYREIISLRDAILRLAERRGGSAATTALGEALAIVIVAHCLQSGELDRDDLSSLTNEAIVQLQEAVDHWAKNVAEGSRPIPFKQR